MTMVIAGETQAIQILMIAALDAIFNNPLPGQQIRDTAGNFQTVPVRAAWHDKKVENPQILVQVESGPAGPFDLAGLVSYDPVSQTWGAMSFMPNAKVVVTIDAPHAGMRENLINWVRWGLQTSYAIDPQGYRMHAYLLQWLAGNGVYPKWRGGGNLFDAPVLDPTKPAGPRPEGQVWTATLAMNVAAEISYRLVATVLSGIDWTMEPTADGLPPIPNPVT